MSIPRRAWWRRDVLTGPELLFMLLVALVGLWLYGLASAARSPAASQSTIDVAPACSDARPPCRGRA